jgi:hypothetical protein
LAAAPLGESGKGDGIIANLMRAMGACRTAEFAALGVSGFDPILPLGRKWVELLQA